MTEYVCGFMFSTNRKNVLLIQKDRPEWQAGKLNGVGGKIEEQDRVKHLEDEAYHNYSVSNELYAMSREFKEEVGIDVHPQKWELFCICEGDNSKIYYFKTFSDELMNFKQMESEEPLVVPARNIWIYDTVPNLQFLVPMALNTNELFTIKCKILGGNNV